ncbi:hypothetical protein AAG570_003519 [Ranatra chinensis]|uniref:Uncharacterized protein n=1 Tax=Ranatra chinensis TaxID=642074 RepID=A0ABD0YLY4_9HEMI
MDGGILQEDWRGRVRGLERISAWLRNGEGGVGVPPRVVPPLLDYLVALVGEERSPRLVTTGLRTLRCLVKTSPSSLLLPALTNGLVSSILRHLGGGSGVSVRLEAVECSKALMRATGPAHVVRVLLSDSCLNAKSSKLRENSLLWLMYALMTFPSGEFDVGSICDAILATGAVEPKRRVRQSVLDTAAVLGQFVSRSRLKVANPSQFEEPAAALFFNEALQARLARRQLPTVSPEGLILYALQVPQASTDVEWVLAGSGSLSAGSARSRAQLENAQRAFISPTQSSDNVYRLVSHIPTCILP